MKNGCVGAMLFLAGCAATAPAPRRPMVTRVEGETRICLDRGTPQPGQQLVLQRRVCAYVPPKNLTRTCRDEPVVTAEVVRVLDDHCVLVRAPLDATVAPGDEVELASSR
jgi:hypothetical protein